MNFEEFKTDALRTESRPEKLNLNKTSTVLMLYAGMEMAKVMDTVKKALFYGKSLDTEKLKLQVEGLSETLALLYSDIDFMADPTVDLIASEDGSLDDLHMPDLHMPNLRILHGAIGMFGEAGELIEAVGKSMVTGKLDLVNVAEETGDSDWYKAIIHDETGIGEETCRAKVVAKLKLRYGDKFSSEAATNRDLAAERAVLETTQV
jgi:NTP pyrophosphatase (non-canonical NTP hydrolase)